MNPPSTLADYYHRIGEQSPSSSRKPFVNGMSNEERVQSQVSSQLQIVKMSLKEKRLQMEQEKRVAEDIRRSNWQHIGRKAFLKVFQGREDFDDENNEKENDDQEVDSAAHFAVYDAHMGDKEDDYSHHHFEQHSLDGPSVDDYDNMDKISSDERYSSHESLHSSSSSSSTTVDEQSENGDEHENHRASPVVPYYKTNSDSVERNGKIYSDASSKSKEDETVRDYACEKGFFISFADEKMPKVKPPPLRPKCIRAVNKEKRLSNSRTDLNNLNHHHTHLSRNDINSLYPSGSKIKDRELKSSDSDSIPFILNSNFPTQNSKVETNKEPKNGNIPGADRSSSSSISSTSHSSNTVTRTTSNDTTLANSNSDTLKKSVQSDESKSNTPGVGFVIGADTLNLDPISELEMARKKEMIIMQSLRRKADHEAKLRAKKLELERKRDLERQIKEQQEKKREEERIRRQIILEQHRLRKAQEDADKDGNSSNFSNLSSRESSRNSSTMLLSRQSRARPSSGTKPRPKSLFVKTPEMHDYTSLDPGSSRIGSDSVDATFSNYASTMALNSAGSNKPPSRPGSSMSTATNCSGVPRRLPSPTSRLPQLPSALMLGRHRGPSSDGASDAGSTFSEYSGPKLYVKPAQKSNRGIILNAINVVLAGAVNSDLKKKVLEEINNSESKHFLILFRGAGMQFRAIYSYNPDREEVVKLHGKGPKVVNDGMMDKFYKYNCGGRNFNEVLTKHLTVTIDAFTIHNTLWSGKRVVPAKKDSF